MKNNLNIVLNWSLNTILSQKWVKHISCSPKNITRYPTKLLRYWFMHNLIKDEQTRLERPLRICEIGVDRGQMLSFCRDAKDIEIDHWVAIDCHLRPELKLAGYSSEQEADVDKSDFVLNEKYDVIIVLHLLEHLFEPEKLVQRLSQGLTSEGIIIGGFPVMPHWGIAYQQKKIRRKSSKFGHVSVFSPQRVKQMAASAGLDAQFMSGAFLLRKTGAWIENHSIWMKINLCFGAMFLNP